MNRKLGHVLMSLLLVVTGAFATDRVCANSPALFWPARGPVTQNFSPSHPAIDIGVHVGTPVAAAAFGTVTYAGWKNNGGGNIIDIDHGNGVFTTYAHLSVIKVATGQTVVMGQLIALSGATGNVTGPHLHFGVRLGRTWVNPIPLLVAKLPNTAMPPPC